MVDAPISHFESRKFRIGSNEIGNKLLIEMQENWKEGR